MSRRHQTKVHPKRAWLFVAMTLAGMVGLAFLIKDLNENLQELMIVVFTVAWIAILGSWVIKDDRESSSD